MSVLKNWPFAIIEVPRTSSDAVLAAFDLLESQGALEEAGNTPDRVRFKIFFDGRLTTPEEVSARIARLIATSASGADVSVILGVEPDRDWSAALRQRFKPFPFLPGVVIVPSWERYAEAPGEIVISMDPGMAFGTGLHETTQLCGEALREHCEHRGGSGHSLLDVGTGSGILAILGRKLGMLPVAAIENDPDALAVARENFDKNGCGAIPLTPELREVRDSFDIVVANILLGALLDLRAELTRTVARGGALILSGILHEQEQELLDAYAPDFDSSRTARRGEWSCISLTRKA